MAGGKIVPAFGTRSSADMLHLVFLFPIGSSPEIAARILPAQQRLAFPYADLVPAARLHVSIQGFDVQVVDWDVRREEILAPARALFSGTPPFTLRLGWLNSFPMAAFLRAEDGGMIRHIRAELRRTLPAWAGLDRDPLVRNGVDEWLPHLSLAYYNGEHDNRALVEAISPLRHEVIVDAPVKEVQLISTPPDLAGADRWRWPLHARLELGSG